MLIVIRTAFDPDRHDLFVWPSVCAAQAQLVLDELYEMLATQHPRAPIAEGGSPVYALDRGQVMAVAWIAPELLQGQVVGILRCVGGLVVRTTIRDQGRARSLGE